MRALSEMELAEFDRLVALGAHVRHIAYRFGITQANVRQLTEGRAPS